MTAGIAGVVVSSQDQNKKQQGQSIQHDAGDAEQSSAVSIALPNTALEKDKGDDNSDNQSGHGSDADWAMVRVTIFLAAVAVIQAAFFYRQLSLMKVAADDAAQAANAAHKSAEAAIAAQRPWVKAEPIFEGPLDFSGGVIRLEKISIRLTNFGNSPAVGVTVQMELVPEPTSSVKRASRLQCVAERIHGTVELLQLGEIKGGVGFTIFPNEHPTTKPQSAAASKTELEALGGYPDDTPMVIYLVGAVNYQFVGASGKTGFIYMIRHHQPGPLGLKQIDRTRESIALGNFVLDRMPLGDVAY